MNEHEMRDIADYHELDAHQREASFKTPREMRAILGATAVIVALYAGLITLLYHG